MTEQATLLQHEAIALIFIILGLPTLPSVLIFTFRIILILRLRITFKIVLTATVVIEDLKLICCFQFKKR